MHTAPILEYGTNNRIEAGMMPAVVRCVALIVVLLGAADVAFKRYSDGGRIYSAMDRPLNVSGRDIAARLYDEDFSAEILTAQAVAISSAVAASIWCLIAWRRRVRVPWSIVVSLILCWLVIWADASTTAVHWVSLTCNI